MNAEEIYRKIQKAAREAAAQYGAAWRRKQGLDEMCEANLDDQMTRVAAILDPVFTPEQA